MAKKTYLDSTETSKRILKGVTELADIVGKTLGPGGRPILLSQGDKPPLSTKDGVTVARHFIGAGDVERIVAEAAREVCERTNKTCGDGTTTAIVLASALLEAGQSVKSVSPQALSRSLQKYYEKEIKPKILSKAKPIKNLPAEEAKKVIYKVALVSANHDEEIAKAVADAVEIVGEDGMINAEEGIGGETKVAHEQGFPFQIGLSDLGPSAGAAFINRKDRSDCFIEGSYIALYDGEILDVNTIYPLMEKVAMEVDEAGRQLRSPLIVMAHGFSDQVLRLMAQNFRQGAMTIVPVKTHSNGQNMARSLFLHDVASYVGGVVFDAQGLPIQSGAISQLGFVESAKIGRDETILLGEPDQEKIEVRINELKQQMEGSSEFDKSMIRYRIGRLTGGIATIYAGGKTALEAKERHARVVDAVSAVRSAQELGVIPGCGFVLAEIAARICEKKTCYEAVESIFERALEVPFKRILENAGLPVPNPIDWTEENGEGMVPNAITGEAVHWYEGGILDPVKVTITALENALSVSQLLMTLGGLIVDESTEEVEKIKQMQQGLLSAINQDAIGD